jgi:hypothetical protein
LNDIAKTRRQDRQRQRDPAQICEQEERRRRVPRIGSADAADYGEGMCCFAAMIIRTAA